MDAVLIEPAPPIGVEPIWAPVLMPGVIPYDDLPEDVKEADRLARDRFEHWDGSDDDEE